MPMMYFLTIVLPVAGYFDMDEDSHKIKMVGAYTLAMALTGAVAVLLLVSGFETIGAVLGVLYVFGILIFSWAANYFKLQ